MSYQTAIAQLEDTIEDYEGRLKREVEHYECLILEFQMDLDNVRHRAMSHDLPCPLFKYPDNRGAVPPRYLYDDGSRFSPTL